MSPKFLKVIKGLDEIDVLVNPSNHLLRNKILYNNEFQELRGLIDENDCYFWKSVSLLHVEVEKYFNLYPLRPRLFLQMRKDKKFKLFYDKIDESIIKNSDYLSSLDYV